MDIPVIQLPLKDGFLTGCFAHLSQKEWQTEEQRRQYKIDNFAFAGGLGQGQFEVLKKEANEEAVKQVWQGWFMSKRKELK